MSPCLSALRRGRFHWRESSRGKILVLGQEFAAKNAICLKESREARFWLRLADAKGLGNAVRRKRLLGESNELVSIYVAVVRSLKRR